MQEFNIGTSVNLPRLIETCALLQASRGGGKSFLMRKMGEQFSGQCQQIIIDLEGEFVTLREQFPFALLSVEGGDIPLNVRHAATYAHKFMESQLSVIVDLSDLKPHDREIFVRDFLHALMHLPKHLYHPLLLYIDEGHKFCPQDESALSTQEVIDVAARGRKRDIGLIVADQRVSKLHKDLTAELLNKVIGRTGQDIDQARAGKELDWKASQYKDLRNLSPGEFYCFGPAFQEDVKKFKVDPVVTTHKRMASGSVAPPTPKAIQSLISALQDLPEEAEKELETKEQLQAEVNRLNAELRKGKASPQATSDTAELLAAREEIGRKTKTIAEREIRISKLEAMLAQIRAIANDDKSDSKFYQEEDRPKADLHIVENMRITKASQPSITSNMPAGGAMRMLKAAAMYYPKQITKVRMAAISGLSHSSGSFGTYLSSLKKDGYITGSGAEYAATKDGMKKIGPIEKLPSGEALIDLWCGIVGRDSGAGRMLRTLGRKYPSDMNKEALAAEVGMSNSSGSFGTYLSTLRRNGLIVSTPKGLKAADELFE
jgi:hypothetical protein